MKLAEKVGNVILSENLTVHKFRVSINRQSFKLLYGDLYSDKIRAIIRELSTNACDSHISAGKSDVPFEVHLPNTLEPYFYVKDFGTGLTPDQVCGEDGIYITFCDSNKNHSDDYTGCLGLGSKSPLSYTDNFTVESNHNGTKYSYAVFMDAEGQPSITPLGSMETDELNGLKVEFAVKEDDFNEFSGKASEILTWFKVRPNVVGHADFKFEEQTYLRKTDRYGVRKERQGESMVIMGNVAYPIQVHDFSYNKITEIEREVIDWGVDLFVDIGDVEFVPSREKLSYSEKTISGVKKYLKDAILSIHNELELQVSQVPSVWAARRMLHDVKHSILGKVRKLGTINYKGRQLEEFIQFHKTVELTMPGIARGDATYPKLEVISKRKDHYRRREEDKIYCDGQRIYINDMERGGFVRIHNDTRMKGGAAYMVTGVNQAFLDETGISECGIKASTLPQPERQPRQARDGSLKGYTKRTVLQQYEMTGGSHSVDWWKDVEVDLRDGGIYVVVSYGQIVGENSMKVSPSELKRKFLAVQALRPDIKLLGIRPAHLVKMEKYKNRWIKFDDYLDSVLKAEITTQLDKINLIRQHKELDYPDRYNCFMNEHFEANSTFGNFIKKVKEAKLATEDVKAKAVLTLNSQANNDFKFADDQVLASIESNLENTYPMFGYLHWYNSDATFVDHMSEYIRAIDNRVQLKKAV